MILGFVVGLILIILIEVFVDELWRVHLLFAGLEDLGLVRGE